MQSPIYWSGEAYRAAMHIYHGNELKRRYEHILGLITHKDSVLDVGCGTGTFQSYLNGNYYLGLELNDSFIRYAKGKKRNVIKQDAMEFDRYHEFDVCVVMDFLHHLTPRHEEFMKKAISNVKKQVIVCEPYVDPGRHPILQKLIRVLDSDGINDSGEWGDKEALIGFYKKFRPARLDELDHTVIAVYEKKHGRKR